MIQGELSDLGRELDTDRAPYVEATVVRAQRPTSARAGSAAIVREDGTIEGFVGGACAEESVRIHALRALESHEPILLRIVPGDVAADEAGEPGAVTVNNPCLSGGALEIFLEPHLPAPIARIAGRGPIGVALADLAERVGYAVIHDPDVRTEAQLGDAAVIVCSHGHDEERILTAALKAAVPYVALVASARRGSSVRESLDLSDDLRAQLRSPAGLRIGAQTPAEIAVAILAEMVATRRGGNAPALPDNTPPAAVDPICGMEVAVSSLTISLELDGDRHHFCSEGCRDRFAAERIDATL